MRASIDHSRQPLERLLAHRYGDGRIYLPKSMNSGVLRDAMRRGLVSEEGFLTRKGRDFLAAASTSTSVGE
jgi:hypothetical protein